MLAANRLGILLVSIDFHPNIGGLANHVHYLAAALANLGHDVEVLTERKTGRVFWRVDQWPRRCTQRDGYRITELPWFMLPRRFLARGGPGYRLVLSRWVRHARALARRGFRVLHWHGLPEIESDLARQVDMAHVFTNHTSGFLDAYAASNAEWAYDRVRFADWLIAPSEELRRGMIHLGFPAERTSYIPNGVDTEQFRPDEARRTRMRADLEIPADAFVLLCARRLRDAQKNGVRYLARALATLPPDETNLHVLVAGNLATAASESSCPYEREVLERFERQPHRVHLLGPVSNEQMPALCNAADASVLPSLREATSLAGLEAMASGLPLLGTTVGGNPDLIEDGRSGLLVPPADPTALAAALRRLVADPAGRAAMGARARAIALERFAWRSIALKTVEIYRTVMESWTHRGSRRNDQRTIR